MPEITWYDINEHKPHPDDLVLAKARVPGRKRYYYLQGFCVDGSLWIFNTYPIDYNVTTDFIVEKWTLVERLDG